MVYEEMAGKGFNCNITFEGNLVHKITKTAFDEPTAETLVSQLEVYADQLTEDVGAVATVRSVELLPVENGSFMIAHTMDRCDGPNHTSLSGESLIKATADTLATIAEMPTLDNYNLLRTPLDSKAVNYHLDDNKPKLVDVFPPLLRHIDGSFPAENIPFGQVPVRRQVMSTMLGTKLDAMSRLVASSLADHNSPMLAPYRNVRAGIPDWCHDVIPANLDPQLKDAIHRQMDQRFLLQNLGRAMAYSVAKISKIF